MADALCATQDGFPDLTPVAARSGLVAAAGEDHVIAFDFANGSFAASVVQLTRLNGQALVFIP
jgi:hypothetical protein